MIKIVTDSTAYLPESTIRRHDIRVVPLYVHFGQEAFREGVELSNEEFYAKLKEAPELPTTSQPSPGDFYTVFKELADAGHEILTLTISSKLSGTWDSAMAARAMLPDAHIEVIDSLSTSAGLQLMVETAVQAVEDGASLQEAAALIESIKARVHVLFVVDTLEYLAKGGRIGNAKALLGTLFKVKPILFLHEGAIEPLEQVRSKRKAHGHIVELVAQYMDGNAPEARLVVTGALVPDEVEWVKTALMEKLGCSEPTCASVGPVIGTHTGPGVVGVGAYC